MKIGSKEYRAIDIMADISTNEQPVKLESSCVRLGISLSYGEQLTSKLKEAGLIISSRGPSGGYSLSRSAKDITILQVISAVKGGKGYRIGATAGAVAKRLSFAIQHQFLK